MTYFPIPDDPCVCLICGGDFSMRQMTAAWREVRQMLSNTGWKRVVADITALRTNPARTKLLDLAKLLWRDFPQPTRITRVVRWDQS